MPPPFLPTPFFKEVDGFSIEATREELCITVPEWMVPVRRYCEVTVTRGHLDHNNRYPHWDIDIVHQEPFTQPRPGKNAWQTALYFTTRNSAGTQHPVYVSTSEKSRRLQRKWGLINHTGRHKDIADLRTGLMRGEWPGTRKARTLIAVTPYGFRIRLYEERTMDARTMQGIGSRLNELARESVTNMVNGAFNHGCLATTTTTPINPESQGVMNMRKVDTTTNLEVPFDTSGTKIVKAVFDNGGGQKDYAYYADESLKDLKVGDYAVVISPYGTVYDEESQGYLNIVQITSLEEDLEGVTKAAKWLVQKVDLSEYRERLAKALRIRTLDARIETAKKEAMKRVELQRLMEASPELADLIKERLSLSAATSDADDKAIATATSTEK